MNDTRQKLVTQIMNSKDILSQTQSHGQTNTVFDRNRTPSRSRGKSDSNERAKSEVNKSRMSSTDEANVKSSKKVPAIPLDSFIPNP